MIHINRFEYYLKNEDFVCTHLKNKFPQKVLIAAQSGKYVERKVNKKKNKLDECVKRKGKNNKENESTRGSTIG